MKNNQPPVHSIQEYRATREVALYNSKTLEEWHKAADKLLDALARDNKYIVSDMMIIFLESAGYGLKNYSPLGAVFKRGADRGIISRIPRTRKQALWVSQIYKRNSAEVE